MFLCFLVKARTMAPANRSWVTVMKLPSLFFAGRRVRKARRELLNKLCKIHKYDYATNASLTCKIVLWQILRSLGSMYSLYGLFPLGTPECDFHIKTWRVPCLPVWYTWWPPQPVQRQGGRTGLYWPLLTTYLSSSQKCNSSKRVSPPHCQCLQLNKDLLKCVTTLTQKYIRIYMYLKFLVCHINKFDHHSVKPLNTLYLYKEVMAQLGVVQKFI